MRVACLLAFVAAAFASWLATFSFQCYYQGPLGAPSVHPRNHNPPYPGSTNDNIFWFLQISDIHLSVANNFEVREDLQSFCTTTVSTVAPEVVLVTGDLTHAQTGGTRRSGQFEEEWRVYGEVLRQTGVRDRQPWLDIRGNHDNYDIVSRSHPSNIFLRYSSGYHSEAKATHSYSYIHTTSFGSYRFIGMDACPSPGPRRPFNFFGVLHKDDLSALQSLVSVSEKYNHSSLLNTTIWFSHYPTATIATDHTALRGLMSSAVAHVCGHLHDPLGGVPMYSRHPSGHLELELIDFKDNRGYRLMAIDHDLFSFVDTRLDNWPLVLITNPKDSHFSVPGREPLGRILNSTHVRMLIFSPYGVTSVRVWLDGRPLPAATVVQEGPLYTTPWDPGLVVRGLHTITVVVEDKQKSINLSHQFTLDGHHIPPLERLPQLLLLTDFKSLFQMVFLFLWLSLLAALVLSWINRAQPVYLRPLARKSSVLFPLTTFIIYFGIGPWCIGEIVTGVYGLIFVHGILASESFIPGSRTYRFGISQLLLWYIPLTLYLNHLLSLRKSSSPTSSPRQLLCHCTMFLLFLYHCGWLLTFSSYGSMALILSPGISWTLPLSLYLFFKSQRSSYFIFRSIL